jgi:hypothetical protein
MKFYVMNLIQMLHRICNQREVITINSYF